MNQELLTIAKNAFTEANRTVSDFLDWARGRGLTVADCSLPEYPQFDLMAGWIQCEGKIDAAFAGGDRAKLTAACDELRARVEKYLNAWRLRLTAQKESR